MFRVGFEPFDQVLAFGAGDLAVKEDKILSQCFEASTEQFVGSPPLTKDHNFDLGLFEDFIQDRDELICLDTKIGFLIEKMVKK